MTVLILGKSESSGRFTSVAGVLAAASMRVGSAWGKVAALLGSGGTHDSMSGCGVSAGGDECTMLFIGGIV